MPQHRWSPTCERPAGLVRPVPVDPDGLVGPTRGQAQRGRFRATSRGLYVPAEVDGDVVEQRILEQSARLRRYGAVTGWAALRWRGANFFDGMTDGGRTVRPVPLVVGLAKLRGDPLIALSQEQLAPSEREFIDGVWCTTVQRAVFDEMRAAPSLREAVVVLDMAAAARLISTSLMAEYVAKRSAWTGVPRVREALLLASDDSRSPQESRMRLVWVVDARLPTPLCNQPVFDLRGNLLGIPDLLDPVAGLVGEYDGADHKEGERHRRDVAREDVFRNHGLEYFEIVGGDLRDRDRSAARMRNARARAKFLPSESRAWTLEPPPWYDVPEHLDDYLARIGRSHELVTT
ncbi:hypothetical protein [Nocardioides speluncae]|uniref:hypothetical protein n=1 Tax=Nocardioides speluncae TaxID=2670337 RepID=UPI000D68EC17|nr:hypothetical protein [Nocardioides speluncae]